MSAFNNDSFAWVNGDDGVTDVPIYVTSTTASTATVHSSTSGSFAITLFRSDTDMPFSPRRHSGFTILLP
jgi:hypothetical protein